MSDFKVLHKYHGILMPYLALLLFAIVFDVGVTLLGLTTPLFTRALFDYAYPYRDLSLLNISIIAIIVVYFLYFFLDVASDYIQVYISQEAAAKLAGRVFHAIQCLPLKFHFQSKPGDLLVRITDDVSKTVEMVASILPTIIIDGGRFAIILAISLFINSKLTLLALVSIPLYILEAKFYAGRLAGVERESIDAESDIYTRTQERLSNIKTIKAFGQERNETLSFESLLRRRYRIAIKGRLLDVVRTFTNSITLQLWSVFLTWYLGYQVVRGTLTIGEIVALMLYLGQLEGPVHAFINLFTDWKTSLVSMRRLDDVLDRPGELVERPGAKDLVLREGSVATSHLSFSFVPNQEVLHEIEVRFPPRSVTAIVGESGSGKTTLVNLLLRFFDPSQGMIFIDGQDISEVRVLQLRGKVGMVQQDSILFDGTVMDNILYGSEGLERGDAMRAARLAGAHDFIERLPGGYDAPVGIGGELLSVGQRQRIAIARVLLRDPAIVIFDEATSALDAESEYHIQETVSSLRMTKTVIIIAHRLSTVKTADNILVLENGRFIEEGTFEDLIEKRGAFYRFYWRQFGGLAAFHRQLDLELERAARYGSKFCLALFQMKNFRDIESSDGILAADAFVEGVDFLIKKCIRMGDNSAVFEHDTILILLPEIDARQLQQFFERMLKSLPRPAGNGLPRPLEEKDMFFFGSCIAKKRFRTPEALLHAVRSAAENVSERIGHLVMEEEGLAKYER